MSTDSSRPRIIAFTGGSSGSGKSTLWWHTVRAMHANGHPAHAMYEEDTLTLPGFAPAIDVFMHRGLTADHPDLLPAVLASIETILPSDGETLVCDSIIPCLPWLTAAGATDGQLADWLQQLQTLLAGIDVIVVYVRADPRIALRRAATARGETWLRDLSRALSGKPGHPNTGQPLDDLTSYFQVHEQRMTNAMESWIGPAISIDTTDGDWQTYAHDIETALGLPTPRTIDTPAPARGRYRAADAPDLIITIRNEDLYANRIWPDGCRLIATAPNTWTFEATNHHLHIHNDQRSLDHQHLDERTTYTLTEAE